MSSQRIRLVVGLGNPGEPYRETRHNAGFLVLDKMAEMFSVNMDKRKFDVVMGRGLIGTHEAILAEPQAYMNRSGPPVFKLANYFKILCEEILIVHDDIDLPFGRIKIKEKGGHGGHNGVRSLMDAFGGGDFVRLRIGIGRPGAFSVTDHVLGRFNDQENTAFDRIIQQACDAIVAILDKGIQEGMNTFNQKIIIT